MPSKFSQLLAHASGGRRFCFVIMSYHEGYSFFKDIKQIVGEETGFECLRADDISAPGENIRDKTHAAIEGAVFLLADITDPRPNICYEIGYAVARNKPVLLLIRKDVTPPTDLHGIEMIPYVDNREGWPTFERDLRQHLRIHKDSNVSLVRAMIVPPDPDPSFLVLNPKKPEDASRFPKHPRERRTYGDYLGLSGVLNAFSSIYGEHLIPQIVSAPHAAFELKDWDANLFLIGSPKVNDFTKEFLLKLQPSEHKWRMDAAPGEELVKDYEVQLTGWLSSGRFETSFGTYWDAPSREDYGLILRGPHPLHRKRTVTIMAGPHSLGTAGACLAATKPRLVNEIAKALAGSVDLTTYDRTFWVLTKVIAGPDHHVDEERVKVIEAGVCT
jgi:nucleoside 2-deoxyribosyltransferase